MAKNKACPLCDVSFKKLTRNKCPTCNVSLSYVGRHKTPILTIDKDHATQIVDHLFFKIEERTGYEYIMSDNTLYKEKSIYYNILPKVYKFVKANYTIDRDGVNGFVIDMIDTVFEDSDYNYIANNISSLSFIAGKIFNKLIMTVIKNRKELDDLREKELRRQQNLDNQMEVKFNL